MSVARRQRTAPAECFQAMRVVLLFAGHALFQTHENLEHLAMMQRVLGPIPESMAAVAHKGAAKYFSHR